MGDRVRYTNHPAIISVKSFRANHPYGLALSGTDNMETNLTRIITLEEIPSIRLKIFKKSLFLICQGVKTRADEVE
jgi:hypothetical protein